jgi:Domain of unknown function (DUF4386)
MQVANASPRRLARLAGLFYLLTILAGIFAQGFVSQRLIVSTDAAATAANILAHQTLFRWSFTAYMIEMACQIVFVALFYELLKPVNRRLSLVAAFLGLAGCIIKTFGRVFYLAPLFVLESTPRVSVFTREQLQALSLFLLKIDDHAAAMALIFFGLYALLTGWLIFRSTFLPRFLGLWSVIAGLGWLTFLYPPLGYRLFNYLAAFGLLGALAIILWLLIAGVNDQRWRALAAATFPEKE